MRLVLAAILLAIPRTTAAQAAVHKPHEPRIFVEVGLGVGASSRAPGREFTRPFLMFGENALMRATYPKLSSPNAIPLALGVSFMFRPSLGIGVSYSRETYENVASLAATIPHSFYFQTPASDTGVTEGALKSRQSATHVSVALAPVRTARIRVSLMGGPSFFHYAAKMVQDVLYRQDVALDTPVNAITIDGVTSADTTGRGVGIHVSGDFAYFFTRTVGAGAGFRYSAAVVDLDGEPMSQLDQQLKVGSMSAVLGVRFAFGG